jgi:hypothetical protein
MKRREFIVLLGGVAVAWPLQSGQERLSGPPKTTSALPFRADLYGSSAIGRFVPKTDIKNMRGYHSISARWWRSVISLRSIIIGTAKRASEKATVPLALGIVIVGLVPAGTRLTVTGFLRPRDHCRGQECRGCSRGSRLSSQ